MGYSRNRWLRILTGFVSIVGFILTVAATDSTIRARYPDDDMGKNSLPFRKEAQIEAAKQFKVFYQFQFADNLKESGITFRYHAVDDITKHMRMGHYDHGSAVAVADVDGDGLYDVYFVNQVGGNELWKNLGGGTFKNITSSILSSKSAMPSSKVRMSCAFTFTRYFWPRSLPDPESRERTGELRGAPLNAFLVAAVGAWRRTSAASPGRLLATPPASASTPGAHVPSSVSRCSSHCGICGK